MTIIEVGVFCIFLVLFGYIFTLMMKDEKEMRQIIENNKKLLEETEREKGHYGC